MKPFNLEEAKAGKPVCTKDGKKARIICFDFEHKLFPIVAAIGYDGYGEQLATYKIDGRFTEHGGESEHDLRMATEKHEGWINIYKTSIERNQYEGNVIFDTREDAEKCKYAPTYITTIKIEWEE